MPIEVRESIKKQLLSNGYKQVFENSVMGVFYREDLSKDHIRIIHFNPEDKKLDLQEAKRG